MHSLRLALALAVSALGLTPALAETQHDEQIWVNATIFGGIKDRLIYFAEAQPRFGSGVSRLEMLLLRPAIGWKASQSVSLYQGYGRVISPIEGGRDRKENRSFQQISWTIATSARHDLSSRTRLEQRWRNDGDDMGLRLREMVRYEVATGHKGLALVGSAEAFIALNDTDWGVRSGFDQLRSFGGVEIAVKGRSTIEIGYMNQLINDPGGRRRMNHIGALNIFIR
ncbi:DUF2490 domain-containing protein [Sphingomonas naphthae]|uniref:DUF2490 domain-containing protein n=1 Tax=Sphingomonas naphthae TaxID=1813468 RepID=A0ABY7TJG5_9SPHN|nr:DUF2490 domain-containing protein [Sphingomonas naphthae]WCT73367.1 DUF2490 domain-containing protein [Sphingomonas naphthae]